MRRFVQDVLWFFTGIGSLFFLIRTMIYLIYSLVSNKLSVVVVGFERSYPIHIEFCLNHINLIQLMYVMDADSQSYVNV